MTAKEKAARKAADAKAWSQVLRGLMSAIEGARRLQSSTVTDELARLYGYASRKYEDCLPE